MSVVRLIIIRKKWAVGRNVIGNYGEGKFNYLFLSAK
jgi:hypothetical protein